MSQKTGDSFAMHSIFYSNETGRDVALCSSHTHIHTIASKRVGMRVYSAHEGP